MIRVNFSLPPELWRQFQAHCIERGQSASEVLRLWMHREIERPQIPFDEPTPSGKMARGNMNRANGG